MKTSHESVPEPLQTQILIQSGLAVLSLFAALSLVAIFGVSLALPFLVLAILTVANAARVYHASVCEQYLTITGEVLKAERTAILKRPKVFIIEIDGKTVHVALRNRRISLNEETKVTLYLYESTPIHEWKGVYHLDSYLALGKSVDD